MSDDDAPFYTENPRGLLELACGTRKDWDRDEVLRAIRAAHDAAVPWPRIVKRLVMIAFRDPSSSPLELRDEAGQRPAPATGPDVYARGASLARELLEQRPAARLTGPQPVLPPEGNAA